MAGPSVDTCRIAIDAQTKALGVQLPRAEFITSHPMFELVLDEWAFVVAVARGAGETEFWVGSNHSAPVMAGAVDAACISETIHGFGAPGMAGGGLSVLLAKAYVWSRALDRSEVVRLWQDTKRLDSGGFDPGEFSVANVSSFLSVRCRSRNPKR